MAAQLRAAEERIRCLEEQLLQKNRAIASLTAALKESGKAPLEDKSKSAGQATTASRPVPSSGLDEEEPEEITEKIDAFISSLTAAGTVSYSQLRATVVNVLSCFHHLQKDELRTKTQIKQPESDVERAAAAVAFRRAVQFLLDPAPKSNCQDNIPLLWLMGMFPFKLPASSISRPLSDSAWLPLHLFLASDPSSDSLGEYMSDLESLLATYGKAALDEEVSPLSIAVAKSIPSLAVVERLVEFMPELLSLEDEDGCTAFMHACAHNQDATIVRCLLAQRPQFIDKEDNFGCSAIHYASFFGHHEVVAFLVEQAPKCVRKVEGNGALPLHDAVQNMRGADEQFAITEALLSAYPEAVYKADQFGAFPIHKAAKSADLRTFRLVHSFFPQALFISDNEDLLPLHFYSQRDDKNEHIDIVQFILQHNPRCDVLAPAEIEKVKKQAAKSFPQLQLPKKVEAAAAERGREEAVRSSQGRRKSCVTQRAALHSQYRK